MTYNFPPVRGVRNIIKITTRKHNIEKMTINVVVSDGKKDYTCQLELISDDGLAKVIKDEINDDVKMAAEGCPTEAIEINEENK